MRSKKNKRNNNITRKYNSNNFNINTLKSFLINLKITDHSKCNIGKNCIIPVSKSGQKIFICKHNVYKIPLQEDSNNFNRVELINKNIIKIDNFNMNLLIQSVIKILPKTLRNKIEHYNKICSLDNKYVLESNRYGYLSKNNIYNSLQDYLLESDDVNINKVCKWLEDIANILNILHNKIQFHHADCKAAQIFLTKNGKAILGDLDKVTFTLNINKKPYRIRLTHLLHHGILQDIVSDIKLPENLNLLSSNEILRFENKPRKTPDLEIASFIASAAILSKTQLNAEIIIDKTKNLYKNYKIVLPSDIATITTPLSLKTSNSFVIPLNAPQYSSKLHSDVSLNIKKNNIILKYL